MAIINELVALAKDLGPEARSIFKDLLSGGKYQEAKAFAKNAMATGEREAAPIASTIARDAEVPFSTPAANEVIHPETKVALHPEAEVIPKQPEPTVQQEVIPEQKASTEIAKDAEVSQIPEALKADPILPTGKANGDLSKDISLDKVAKLPQDSYLLSDGTKKSLKTAAKWAVPATGVAAVGAAMLGGGDGSNEAKAMPVVEPKQEETAPPMEQGSPLNWDAVSQKALAMSKGPAGAPKPTATAPAPAVPSSLDALSKMLNFEANGNQQPGLADAIAKQNEALKDARINKYLGLIGQGAARLQNTGVEADYQQSLKESGLPIEQFKMMQADQENNPQSGISAGMRDYLKTLGVNVSEHATAAQMKQIVPYVFKDVEAKQAQQSKHDDLQMKTRELGQRRREGDQRHLENREQIQANRDQHRLDVLDKQGQDQANKMNQQAEQLRGNPAIQQDMRTIQRVQNAMSIIKQFPDPNKIPPHILNILDTDLATIASGGVPGEGMIHEVATPTFMKSFATAAQKYLNQPTGANAAQFVQQNEGIFNTLAGDATKRLKDRYRRIGNTLGRNVGHSDREAYRRTYLQDDVYDPKTNDFSEASVGRGSEPTSGLDPDAAAAELAKRRKK